MMAISKYCVSYQNNGLTIYVKSFDPETGKVKLTHAREKAALFTSRLRARHISKQINLAYELNTVVDNCEPAEHHYFSVKENMGGN